MGKLSRDEEGGMDWRFALQYMLLWFVLHNVARGGVRWLHGKRASPLDAFLAIFWTYVLGDMLWRQHPDLRVEVFVGLALGVAASAFYWWRAERRMGVVFQRRRGR